MTITEQKAAQRKAGIAARRALSDTERTSSNAALCARIMALDCFKKAENILLYAAFGGEADLSALAVEAARQGKTLAYPVCGEGFSLTAAVPGPDGWEVGTYGIRTPILSRSEILRPDQLDLVLVPCTAFDAGLPAKPPPRAAAAQRPSWARQASRWAIWWGISPPAKRNMPPWKKKFRR